MTTWIDIDRLLALFGSRATSLPMPQKAGAAIRGFAARSHLHHAQGREEALGPRPGGHLPVSQFEKLWGDMTAHPGYRFRFLAVPRRRGQQLKEQAQLDGWLRDGSAAHVEGLCQWE